MKEYLEGCNKIRLKFKCLQVVTDTGGGMEEYEGEYTVTPKIVDQTLITENKVLKSNIKIQKIPRLDTSNNSGGITVYIGGV